MTRKSTITRIWRVYGQVRDCDVENSPMNVCVNFNATRSIENSHNVGTYAAATIGLPQSEADALALALVQQDPRWNSDPAVDIMPIGKCASALETRPGVEVGSYFLSPEECETFGLALIRAAQAARINHALRVAHGEIPVPPKAYLDKERRRSNGRRKVDTLGAKLKASGVAPRKTLRDGRRK